MLGLNTLLLRDGLILCQRRCSRSTSLFLSVWARGLHRDSIHATAGSPHYREQQQHSSSSSTRRRKESDLKRTRQEYVIGVCYKNQFVRGITSSVAQVVSWLFVEIRLSSLSATLIAMYRSSGRSSLLGCLPRLLPKYLDRAKKDGLYEPHERWVQNSSIAFRRMIGRLVYCLQPTTKVGRDSELAPAKTSDTTLPKPCSRRGKNAGAPKIEPHSVRYPP